MTKSTNLTDAVWVNRAPLGMTVQKQIIAAHGITVICAVAIPVTALMRKDVAAFNIAEVGT